MRADVRAISSRNGSVSRWRSSGGSEGGFCMVRPRNRRTQFAAPVGTSGSSAARSFRLASRKLEPRSSRWFPPARESGAPVPGTHHAETSLASAGAAPPAHRAVPGRYRPDIPLIGRNLDHWLK